MPSSPFGLSPHATTWPTAPYGGVTTARLCAPPAPPAAIALPPPPRPQPATGPARHGVAPEHVSGLEAPIPSSPAELRPHEQTVPPPGLLFSSARSWKKPALIAVTPVRYAPPAAGQSCWFVGARTSCAYQPHERTAER